MMKASPLAAQLPDDSRKVARGVGEDGLIIFEQVGIEEINFKGRFGALVTSGSSNSIAVGNAYFRLDYDDGKFQIGDDILIVSKDDPDMYEWATVIDKDTVEEPARLRVHVDDISPSTGTSENWELQVVARPKPGIEKDTSTTSVAFAAVGSTMTFTVQADKFFPIGGKLLVKALATQTAVAIGRVSAYSGTSLVLEIVAKTTAASGTFASWSLALLDAPQDKIPYYQISGLRISVNGADSVHDIDVSAGSVRSYDDTVDLILPSRVTKRLDAVWAAGTNNGAAIQADLAGTVSSSGLNVTGTGTSFLSDFWSPSPFLTDLDNQYTQLTGSGLTPSGIVLLSTAATTVRVTVVTTDTALQTGTALGALAGTTFKRGGPMISGTTAYGIVIMRRDSDGVCHIGATSLTPSGAPDLPTGYTKYRVIGYVEPDSTGTITILQPLVSLAAPTLDQVSFPATSTLFGNNASGVLESHDVSITDHETRIGEVETDIVTIQSEYDSGTFTPTTSNNVNLDANPTVGVFEFIRIKDTVFFSGNVAFNPTTGAGTTTGCDLTITRATNFSSTTQAHGVTTQAGTTAGVGHVESVSGAKALRVVFAAQNTANHQVYMTGSYQLV
jgi:hypothetical protein